MPELSVVIATYNRVERLRACLDALCGQTQSAADFEVVVVVDGSTDGTRELLAAYQAPFHLRAVWQSNAGQAKALNRGVTEAAGSFCLLLDDDVLAGPRLVAEHLRAHRERSDLLAIGRLALATRRVGDWYVPHFAASWERHYASLRSDGTVPSWGDCYSGNLSFPRAAFGAVGGFCTDLRRGYDVELAFRLMRRGLTPIYLPEADATQDEHKGFQQLIRDEELAGASSFEIYRRHPATLPDSGLGSFRDASPAMLALRRLFLALNVPPVALGPIGRLLQRLGRGGRWARFVRAYSFWRGVRRATGDQALWRRLTGGVAILLYHAVTMPGEASSRYVVCARRFARQMRWLRLAGRHVLGLDEYLRCRREHRLPPARAVVLTFDDGYRDNGTIAQPILAQFRFPATIFLVTDFVGGQNRWDSKGVLHDRALLGWDETRTLARSGIQFGSHTLNHPVLTALPAAAAELEIAASKAALERHLPDAAPAFAYPYGVYDETVRALVERAGFWGACTTRTGLNGPGTPLFELRRVEVRGEFGLMRFLLAILVGDSRLVLLHRVP
jgi:glycosyltransferase involved in cell wall biosynthesis/peptidoglycan/xylan/chitin deacetylase (PgdA/CDA1 family)